MKLLQITSVSILLLLSLFFLLIGGCSTSENEMSPAEFYDGKTACITVSNEAGTFVDLISRVIANYLADDISGNVIVENRRGAGGLEGTNYLAEAKSEGLELGTFGLIKTVSNKILNNPGGSL